ncbi:unnamed protein product, partial [marine sediment metagenome]
MTLHNAVDIMAAFIIPLVGVVWWQINSRIRSHEDELRS